MIPTIIEIGRVPLRLTVTAAELGGAVEDAVWITEKLVEDLLLEILVVTGVDLLVTDELFPL